MQPDFEAGTGKSPQKRGKTKPYNMDWFEIIQKRTRHPILYEIKTSKIQIIYVITKKNGKN
jgi:hypothetical protein